jgi:hypothetical protein
MSILDDAIREHLELKRSHGADESELERLENEAFGPAERPDQPAEQVDPFAEAPTEFLSAPGEAPAATPGDPPTGGRRMPNVADLQEPPPPKPAEAEGDAEAPEPDGPAEEEHPAMEHETIAQPAPDDRPAPPTDELQPDPEAPRADAPPEDRPPITEQPTELFDVEGQFGEGAAESESPSDEQLLDAERSEPRLTPVEPLPDEEPADEFDEFFSEQRLSDELNQALEAPLPDEPGAPPTDESLSPFLDPDTELGPATERKDEPQSEEPEEPEPPIDRTVEQPLPEDSREHDLPEESGELDVPDEPREEADIADEDKTDTGRGADPLEDTPEFLEDEEDDDAWFEQRPPKDFDFGD